MTCEKCGRPAHRDDAMNMRCNGCERLVRQCDCTAEEPERKLPENMLLAGIVGSTAYGLDGPDSDIDRMGVYAAPTVKFHGLQPPVDKRGSIIFKDPDAVYHEALKWIRLVLQCNPSVTELLWLETYEEITPLGLFLVNRRQHLLSATNVRNRYLGYATGQFDRLRQRGGRSFSADTKPAKHARHILRLLDQGFELYSTGHLTVRLSDPQKYHDFGEQVAVMHDGSGIRVAERALGQAKDRFDNTTSPLPEWPDMDLAEGWLQMVRKHYWN